MANDDDPDGATAYITGPGGLPIEQITASGQIRYYHSDAHGNVTALTDASGATVASYKYAPYGAQTITSGSNVTNPFGYSGQYTDRSTGLQYLRARYYDPDTGQFLTRDPLEALTRQAYSYAGGDPVNHFDPHGMFCLVPGTEEPCATVQDSIEWTIGAIEDVATWAYDNHGPVIAGLALTACIMAPPIACPWIVLTAGAVNAGLIELHGGGAEAQAVNAVATAFGFISAAALSELTAQAVPKVVNAWTGLPGFVAGFLPPAEPEPEC